MIDWWENLTWQKASVIDHQGSPEHLRGPSVPGTAGSSRCTFPGLVHLTPWGGFPSTWICVVITAASVCTQSTTHFNVTNKRHANSPPGQENVLYKCFFCWFCWEPDDEEGLGNNPGQLNCLEWKMHEAILHSIHHPMPNSVDCSERKISETLLVLLSFYFSAIMNSVRENIYTHHEILGRRRQTNPHPADSYVWIAFCAGIGVNMFSDIKRKPDTLSIRRLTLAVILSLGFSRTFNRLCQKGQLPMNWHQHLVVI